MQFFICPTPFRHADRIHFGTPPDDAERLTSLQAVAGLGFGATLTAAAKRECDRIGIRRATWDVRYDSPPAHSPLRHAWSRPYVRTSRTGARWRPAPEGSKVGCS